MLVKIIDDFLDFITVGIHFENLLDDKGSKFVFFVAMLGIDFVSESNLPAVAYAFQNVFGHTTGNFFGKFCRIELRHAFKNRFKEDTFRTLADSFFR